MIFLEQGPDLEFMLDHPKEIFDQHIGQWMKVKFIDANGNYQTRYFPVTERMISIWSRETESTMEEELKGSDADVVLRHAEILSIEFMDDKPAPKQHHLAVKDKYETELDELKAET